MESSRLIPELHVIVPSSETKMASTPSVCSTSCIPFLIRGKTGCAECIPVHGDVTDDGYLIEMVLTDIRSRCLKYGDTVCR